VYRLDGAVRGVLNCSVKQAILERRLLEAKRLLRFTIRSVEDVGYSLGFDDPSYFSRLFRRMSGKSPSDWRADN
jgi:AraC family transcriptional activator of pobA